MGSGRTGILLLLGAAGGILGWALLGGGGTLQPSVAPDSPAQPPASAAATPSPGPPAPIPPIWAIERAESRAGRTAVGLVLQLVNPAGHPLPLPGVTLRLQRFAAEEAAAPVARLGELRTDAAGRADCGTLAAELADLEPETPSAWLAIDISGGGVYAPLGRLDDTRQCIALWPLVHALRAAAAGDRVVVPVTARTARPVTFRVVDHDGRPMPGVTILAEPAARFELAPDGESDAKGLITFRYRGAQPLDTPGRGPRDDRFVLARRDLEGELLVLDCFRYTPRPGAVAAVMEAARDHAVASRTRGRLRDVLDRDGLADTVPRLVVGATRRLDLVCEDGRGGPVADTELVADTAEGTSAPAEPVPFRTDGTGRAALRVRRDARLLSARVTAGGYFPAEAAIPPQDTPIPLVLHRIVRVTVELAYARGVKHLPLAALRWAIELEGRHVPLAPERLEFQAGAIAFDGPAAPFVVRATSADRTLGGEVEMRGTADERRVLKLGAVEPAFRVTFYLTDAHHVPLARTQFLVRAIGDDAAHQVRGTYTSNAAGRLSVPMRRGSYQHVLFFWTTEKGAPRVAEMEDLRVEGDDQHWVRWRPPVTATTPRRRR